MPERWERDLRKLDALKPPGDLSDRIGAPGLAARPLPPRPNHPFRQAVTIAVVFALFLPAAYFAWSTLQPAESPLDPAGSDLPDVGHIVCEEDGTSTTTPRFQVRSDGIHLAIDSHPETVEVFMLGVDGLAGKWAAASEVPFATSTARALDLPPGDYLIGCFTQGQLDGYTDRWDLVNPAAPFRDRMIEVAIEDPTGLYVYLGLDCQGGNIDTYRPLPIEEWPVEMEDPRQMVRSVLTGINRSMEIKAIGYPEVSIDQRVRVSNPGGFVVLDRVPLGYDEEGPLELTDGRVVARIDAPRGHIYRVLICDNSQIMPRPQDADEKAGVYLREPPADAEPGLSLEEIVAEWDVRSDEPRPRLMIATSIHPFKVDTGEREINNRLVWVITDPKVCIASFGDGSESLGLPEGSTLPPRPREECPEMDRRTLIDANTGEGLMGYSVPHGKGLDI